MSLPTETLREQNMQKRRARLLAEARALLTAGGFEAMNLRDLARRSEVTVPTIYNLIGNKEEVLVALFAEALAEIEARVHTVKADTPLALAAAAVEESTGLFAEDEQFYRPAFVAVDTFHAQLMKKIAALAAPEKTSRTARAKTGRPS